MKLLSIKILLSVNVLTSLPLESHAEISPLFCKFANIDNFVEYFRAAIESGETCVALDSGSTSCSKVSKWRETRPPLISVINMGGPEELASNVLETANYFARDFGNASSLPVKVSDTPGETGTIPIFLATDTFSEKMNEKNWFSLSERHNSFLASPSWSCFGRVYFNNSNIVAAPIFVKTDISITKARECILGELVKSSGLFLHQENAEKYDIDIEYNYQNDIPVMTDEQKASISLLYNSTDEKFNSFESLKNYIDHECRS